MNCAAFYAVRLADLFKEGYMESHYNDVA